MALQIGKLYEITDKAGISWNTKHKKWYFICRINKQMKYLPTGILVVVLNTKPIEPNYKRTSPFRDHLIVNLLLPSGEIGTVEGVLEKHFKLSY